jgi:sodium transport system ATP-binding protein
MSEVEKLCDRVAVMHQGRILDCGTLTELGARHGHHDVEELFFSLVTSHDRTALSQTVLQGAG